MAEKYIGEQRDPETGLDWLNVRHMAGSQGRFTSVDPENAGADASSPQTWNGYSYGGNNPLANVDPTGLGLCGVDPNSDSGIEKSFCLAEMMYEYFIRQQQQMLSKAAEKVLNVIDISRPRDPN